MKIVIHGQQFLCKPKWYTSKRSIISFLFLFFAQHIFSQAPSITAFAPTSAAKGHTVVITGTNFTGTTAVSFGSVAATSFTIVSATQINAVVPLATAGSVNVTNPAGTGTRTGFYYLPLSGIITDFAGYWPTTTISNSSVYPDDSHNLVAFTYNGVTYSTGVNDPLLTGQGIAYKPGNFRALPVANIAGTNSASAIYLATASKIDGYASVANTAFFTGKTIKDVMTDGPHGLNMGTGITNLPASALMTFNIHLIDSGKINDAEPDIVITQIADPTSGNDVFQFIDSAGNTVGTTITQNMLLLTKLGTYYLDLFNLSPSDPFNSAICYSAFQTNSTRDIRLAGFKLADFGITSSNYLQVAALKIAPSGTSDYAFIAYSDAIAMSPNISQNIERSNSSICAGGVANLEVIATAAYGGALSYVWQVSTNSGASWSTVADGGIYSGAGTSRLTVTSATNNYRYRATVTESGTGYNATSAPFTVAVIAPAAPTGVTVAATATTCLNNLYSLAASVTGGSNLYYRWESNASGSYVTIPDAILRTYLPPVSTTGVISYQVKVSSGSGCTTITSPPVTITVAGITTVSNAARCGTGSVSLAATATSGTISWFTASTGGSAIATGAAYSPSISASATYYVSTDASACTSGTRVPVRATINTIEWAGTNTTAWSSLSNWNCGGVAPAALPTSTSNVTIPTVPSGGRFPTITTTVPINNITIAPGASITIGTGGTFEIYGSISNSGTFTATDGTISMRGSSQQNIPANVFSTNTIKNLTINNAAGVLLNGSLNITGTYTPTAGVLTTFGYLTLKSDASGTARVAQGTANYVLGNVNVERYIPARRSWRLMTAPITNSGTIYQSWQNNGVYTVGKGTLVTAPTAGPGVDAVGNSSLKTWNVATQAFQAVTNTQVPISATNNGSADNTGYFVFLRGDRLASNIDPAGIRKNVTTLLTTGYLQTGTQTYSNLSTKAGGFTLVGNPYASPVNWNLVLANTGTTNIKRKIYVWDPQLNSVGGYVVMDDAASPGVFVATPASSSQNNYLQSSQAFYVITNTAAAATVEIKESNKATINNTSIFGRPVETVSSFIAGLKLLDTTDNSTIDADGLRVDFNDSFSAGIDDDDNIKFSNVNETFGLVRNNSFLATERRPAIVTTDTLFLKLNKSTQRSYRFEFSPAAFGDNNLTAFLEDSYTGMPTVLDLDNGSTVDFSINAAVKSQAADRFRIVFVRSAPLPVTFTSVKAYRQQKATRVEWKVETELNIRSYQTERSTDGRHFETIATTQAIGNGDHAYTVSDTDPTTADQFYRIKSIGIDQKIAYSETVKVKGTNTNTGFVVYPNPVSGKQANIQFSNQPAGSYELKVSNEAGQLVWTGKLQHNAGSPNHTIQLPAALQAGTYQVEIRNNESCLTNLKILLL